MAWSICDWVWKVDCTYQSDSFKTLNDFQQQVRDECPPLRYLQDLTNFVKHREITRYTPILSQARVKEGAFSTAFSRDFDVPGLKLTLQDGRQLWFEDVIEEALSYWDGYFKDKGI